MFCRRRLFITLLVLAALVSQALAQQNDPSILTLDRLFGSTEFAGQSLGPVRWLDDGAGYTRLEPSGTLKGGRDIARYDAETGRREVLVAAERFVPTGSSIPLAIEDYDWSPGGKLLLIFTNSQRVWRVNTRGDYWVLNLGSGKLAKLGGDAKPSTLMFAKFAPDGTRVGYVRENNLYVETLADHRISRLTDDGSRTIINGTFDWVYEEELDLRDGWRWSPDGQNVAYWQLDSEGVRTFYLVDNTSSLYPILTPIPYPKAGETNSASRVGVVSARGGSTKWLDVPGDPRNHYIARMNWAASSEQIVLQQLNRLQNTNLVMIGDIRTGKVRTILTDRDDAWVDIHGDDVAWLDDGKRFLWVSERDGWRHAYAVSRDGSTIKLLTPGEFDVISVESVDKSSGWLYCYASPENATQRYLYRVALDGRGKLERVTPAIEPGTHSYDISPGARFAFHTYSSFGNPPRTDLVRLPAHTSVRSVIDNAELFDKVNKLKRGVTEFFRVDIGGGVQLDGWMMKPFDFDPAKRYPVLFHVYGEPAGQRVLDRWFGENYLWHLILTQQGYIVVSVDNRGTPSPRGRAWRKIVYRQIGVLASQEQAAAAKAIMARWKFVDAARIGIWGWSGGGSMTLNMMFRYPEIYKTGMSVAPVSNQRFYDTIYQERYVGLPQQNDEDYKRGSPITFAEKLQGNLLVVHGTGDDNVHYQNTEALINALVAANKPFTLMSYPNRTHSISEGANTSRHLFELLTRYLQQNLPAGPR
ncbi:MAG TPA: S9 family peptidase [Blastocatellia bacterium]|nr:S9 family peptidase [Blastocatellia bacterium]